ncbi:MAG: FCSD flavin-binding domain-containing protein [Betaproteobacteria bacterium]|nr:FCSD flavin-binding domain-containing protein [Betaproteobacteria bacterium]MDE2122616.1 FCSD flavin-binding domain-containing protein [Betaproteobacteria bacterium]MDE2186564.1 FCSD flavin-binding domain-containing protein [Betaproteobacteria bacterium]MDE2324076.1 FCSD flavin-binding domain-containing protein [Betaproteobacteria bacterium]
MPFRGPGSGGISTGIREIEAAYAEAWATNIWADTLTRCTAQG